jgi:glycine betaine catabolism B
MVLNFIQKIQNTADCFSFFFDSPDKVIFKAGQHMHFTLPHDNPDDRGISRYFTISSAPHEGHIMITTRIAREHSSTFKNALMRMGKGQEITVKQPQGKFIINDYSGSYVFFAGGIGITPFRSILVDLDYIKKIKEMEVFLLYTNRSSDIVFKDELDLLSTRNSSLIVRYIISPEVCNIEMLKAVIPKYRDKTYYISGPPGMVKSIGDSLTAENIGDSRINRDFFPGYQ